MSNNPVRLLYPLPTDNLSTVYRTCRECQMEVSWPMRQSSLTHCPYCGTPYRTPVLRDRVKEWAVMTAATILVCLGVIGVVGLLVRIGSSLFL